MRYIQYIANDQDTNTQDTNSRNYHGEPRNIHESIDISFGADRHSHLHPADNGGERKEYYTKRVESISNASFRSNSS